MNDTFVVVVGLFNLVLLVVQLILLGVNVATRRVTPGAADQTLTARLESLQADRAVMDQLERAYQGQNTAYKTAMELFIKALQIVSPVTPLKGDDALRDFLKDVAVPGKPSMEDVADDIYKPTPDDSPHRSLAPFTAVNPNPALEGDPIVIKIPDPPQVGVDQRILARPPYYGLIYQPDAVPWVHHKAGVGYEFSIEWLKGSFGMSQAGVKVYAGDYLLKLVAEIDFADEEKDFAVCASVALDGNLKPLTPHTLVQGSFEYIWAVRFSKAGSVAFDVFLKSEWAARGGKMLVKAIRLETLPENSGYTVQVIG